uniref:Uncharacterized protein n=1 Tax=Rhizophora mucronata TaxID=61149 RepID=A0A2P2PAR8_RHIMU
MGAFLRKCCRVNTFKLGVLIRNYWNPDV